MLDIGWSEILVIAVVMIVVVGPKDLPKMLRAFGKASAKFRATANEFRTHFDDAVREAELDDVKKAFSEVKKYDPRQTVVDILEPVRTAGDDLRSSLINSAEKIDAATPQSPAVSPAMAMDSAVSLDTIKAEEAKLSAPATTPEAVSASVQVSAVKKTRAKAADKQKTEAPSAKPEAKTVKSVAAKKTTSDSIKPAVKKNKKTGADQ